MTPPSRGHGRPRQSSSAGPHAEQSPLRVRASGPADAKLYWSLRTTGVTCARMKIAILTFDGFNELDSLVAAYVINRVVRPGWKAITCPAPVVESGEACGSSAQQPLEFASKADAVLVGSGALTGRLVEDGETMSRLALDPRRQLIGSQCSGALILAKLGLLGTQPACTDRGTRPLLEAAGVRVLGRPFFASGNVATAGGCLSSHYLATWFLWRLAGRAAAEEALAYVAPVGQESEYVARAMGIVGEFIAEQAPPEAQSVSRVLAP